MQASRKTEVLVIGGGIAGCGIARDLSLRGIDTVLVEKEDFGSGTTGRSSRLIHGGLRYLQHGELKLVREGLRERERLLHIAPHLVKPLEFIIPIYEDSKPGRRMLKAAMVAYDFLSYDKSIGNHKFMKRADTLRRFPFLASDSLVGAFSYFDAQVELVERLCLENVVDAEMHGALAFNHTGVGRIDVSDGKARSAEVIDGSGKLATIEAGVFVNATGPWLDTFAAGPLGNAKPMLSVTKGVHIITEGHTDSAMVIPGADGRLLFVIPWMNKLLIGTTDTKYTGSADSVHADQRDIEYLTGAMRKYVPGISLGDFGVYAGLRPLARSDNRDPTAISRNYRIKWHDGDGVANLVSIAGSKITEYRSMAEKVGDSIAERLGVSSKSLTGSLKLPGAGSEVFRHPAMNEETYNNLLRTYGSRAGDVMRLIGNDSAMAARICPHNPDILAQARFAAESEHAKSITDFMFRRTGIGYSNCGGLDGLNAVASVMGTVLGWNTRKMMQEKEAFLSYPGYERLMRDRC